MDSKTHYGEGTRWGPTLRIAAVALAAAGWSAVAFVPATAGAASGHASNALVISAVNTTSVGTVLDNRTTLYTLKPSSTACAAACLKTWPEVLLPKGVTRATAGSGVVASKLGTIARAGGLFQVTYGGKPLYRFFKDKAPGQVKGDTTDKWGKWTAVVTAKGAGGVTTTTSPGGGGVGF